jgi:hypothetical protein
MITIAHWYGRNGNNIMQLIHAIYYAKLYHHNLVCFPVHPFLNSTTILLPEEGDQRVSNNSEVKGSFFHIGNEFNLQIKDPYEKKLIFLQYIKPIFLIKPNQKYTPENTLFIHVRSGDIFEPNPHPGYVQPPLCYYSRVIGDFDNVVAVCEDDKNPCVKYLRNFPHLHYESNSVTTDLAILSGIHHFQMGLGVFGMLIYWMNEDLKTLYIPRYVVEKQMGLDASLPLDWGPNITVHIVDFPNYIQCGEWVNSEEQRKLMIQYNV